MAKLLDAKSLLKNLNENALCGPVLRPFKMPKKVLLGLRGGSAQNPRKVLLKGLRGGRTLNTPAGCCLKGSRAAHAQNVGCSRKVLLKGRRAASAQNPP